MEGSCERKVLPVSIHMISSQVRTEDGVLVFAEGEVASAFSRMLLGDGEAELLGEIVTKEEERAVAEVVPKNTKLKETPKYKITGG